ncbi:MAG: outer membrane beta-barrel protein [Pseudomonadota bacterium]
MRALFILAILVAVPVAAQAQGVEARAGATAPLAVANGPYLAGSLGYLAAEDADISPGGDIGRDDGYATHLAFGHKYGRFRGEAELGWKLTDASPGGDVAAASLMANGYWDIRTGTRFVPYLGGGLGLAWVDVDGALDDDDMVLAWQLMAGVSYTMTERMDVYGGYRFFDVADADLEVGPARLELEDLRSHIIEVGVRYRL